MNGPTTPAQEERYPLVVCPECGLAGSGPYCPNHGEPSEDNPKPRLVMIQVVPEARAQTAEAELRALIQKIDWGLTDLTYTAPEDTARQRRTFGVMREALDDARASLPDPKREGDG